MFNFAFNTIKGVGAEMGGIIGIKGGQGWMREQFGVESLGGAMKPFGQAFGEGGIIGMGRHAKSFFGIGFDPRGTMGGMGRYMETVSGYQEAFAVPPRGARVSREQRLSVLKRGRAFGQTSATAFRRRRIAGGVGAAVGLAGISSTIGLGNVATLGIGAGLGVAGGRYFARAGTRDLSTWGRRGGKLGFAAAGVGLMTGLF